MNLGQKIIYELKDETRKEAASILFNTVPCLQVFSLIALLADEIGMERQKLLDHCMAVADKLERGE